MIDPKRLLRVAILKRSQPPPKMVKAAVVGLNANARRTRVLRNEEGVMHLCDATGRLLAAAGPSAPALGAHRADRFRPVSSDSSDKYR